MSVQGQSGRIPPLQQFVVADVVAGSYSARTCRGDLVLQLRASEALTFEANQMPKLFSDFLSSLRPSSSDFVVLTDDALAATIVAKKPNKVVIRLMSHAPVLEAVVRVTGR